MIEVLKQMQEALREYHYYTIDAGLPNQSMLNKGYAAYQAGLKAIAELESQEPVGWHLIEALYPQGERLDIRMGDGSILCNLLPQADGDLWWEGSGTGEKFIDPVYADVTHWRVHSDTHPSQHTWRGLTTDEIAVLHANYPNPQGFALALQAKLKQKNGFAEEKNT